MHKYSKLKANLGLLLLAMAAGGCVVESNPDLDEVDELRTLEQEIWAENNAPFEGTFQNVDIDTTGRFGSVVQIRSNGSVGASAICSGTLIARDKVLTAGHCGGPGLQRFVGAGPNAFNNPNTFIESGTMIWSPDAGTEEDQWFLGGVLGAHDLAILALDSPVPATHASVYPVHLGSRSRNGLNTHEGGGNPNDIVTFGTLIGYGEPCKFGLTCATDSVRRTVQAWAYNWVDPCPGGFTYCSDVPTIAVSQKRSGTGASPGDSGGPIIYNNKVVGVLSMQVRAVPGAFTGNVYAPVTTNLGNALWLQSFLDLANDVERDQVGLLATDELRVNDRADMTGTAAGGSVEIGADAFVDGDVFAHDDVLLRDRGGFSGLLKSYNGIDVQNAPGEVGDFDIELPQLPIDEIEDFEDFVCSINWTGPTNWSNYEEHQIGDHIALPPGQHNRVRVKRGVSLLLTPGTYYFRDLDIDAGAKIEPLGSGPIHIFVENKLDLKGDIEGPGPESQLFFGLCSSETVHIQQPAEEGIDMQATIVAPNAKVEIHSRVTYWGQVIAQDVELHQDAIFEYRPFVGGSHWQRP